MSEALLQNPEYGRRDGNYFLRGRDRGPRRRDNCLHHADHVLDSADNGLLEGEDVPDPSDYFPGLPEDGLRLCDHCLPLPDQGLGHKD